MALDKIPGTTIFDQRDVRETPTSTATASAGASADAQYITLATDAVLTAERVLTAGEGIDFTDNGAGSTLIINGEDATAANKGIASFSDTDFTVTNGDVTIDDNFLRNDGVDQGVGLTLTGDNSSPDTAYVPMVLYNTDATPPTASNFPIGTIYVQYTA